MEWALNTATNHPDLSGAIVTADGEWLDVLLPDRRTFRFRPAALIKESAPQAQREELLYRLLSIGVAQASQPRPSTPPAREKDDFGGARAADAADAADASGAVSDADRAGENIFGDLADAERSSLGSLAERDFAADPFTPAPVPADPDTPIVPIVRAADYFIASHHGEDSMIYVPLTDFVGVGLAFDLPQTIQLIYYSQVEQMPSDVGELLAESVNALRRLVGQQRLAVDLGVTRIAGCEVVTFLAPDNYELSWFCDVEMMQEVARRLQESHPDNIPLFVPAARTKLYVVFSEDPHLVDFFTMLLTQRHTPEAVYPLPHTVADDGWREWVPFPGSPLAEVLGALRHEFRAKIYAAQVKAMEQWGDLGALKPYEPKRMRTGERVSACEWDALDGSGSIPDTDFISFVRQPSPHPWEESRPVRITMRAHIAREIWPAGFEKAQTAWPPRWIVTGFPADAVLAKLAASADRDF